MGVKNWKVHSIARSTSPKTIKVMCISIYIYKKVIYLGNIYY